MALQYYANSKYLRPDIPEAKDDAAASKTDSESETESVNATKKMRTISRESYKLVKDLGRLHRRLSPEVCAKGNTILRKYLEKMTAYVETTYEDMHINRPKDLGKTYEDTQIGCPKYLNELPERKWKPVKSVWLFNGKLILDIKLTKGLLENTAWRER